MSLFLSAAAATALTLAAPSDAAAGRELPAQASAIGAGGSTTTFRQQPEASTFGRARSDGQIRFLVTLPAGPGAGLPLIVRLHSADRATGLTSAAVDRDDDFIRAAVGR
jgi:hypothetical protein